jgi:hypothetical protein
MELLLGNVRYNMFGLDGGIRQQVSQTTAQLCRPQSTVLRFDRQVGVCKTNK